MPSYGPKAPGTLADDATVGTLTWADTANAAASDDAYATVSTGGISHYLKATNFDFSEVPANDVLTQLVITIERQKDAAGEVIDDKVFLVKSGTIDGTTNKNHPDAFSANDEVITYTWSAANLAAVGFTTTDLKAATSGVVLSISLASAPNVGKIDAFAMTATTTTGDALTDTAVNMASGDIGGSLRKRIVGY